MPKNVLAVSSQPAFGELLRISLEKSGNYRVKLLRTGSEVLSTTGRESFDLAVLDADLKDQPIVPLLQNLRLQQPHIKIIIIPSTDAAVQHALTTVKVDGFLPKPFNLADLMQLAERLTSGSPLVPTRSPSPVFSTPEGHSQIDTKWIEDRQQVQQNMFRLSLQSATNGVFLFQGNELYAQASKLEHIIDHQIIEIFLHSWDKKTSMDLIKFFRDKAEKKKWLLYATILVKEFILVMIFAADLPLHEVRGHVIRMANGLSNASQTSEARDDVMKFLGDLEEKIQIEQAERDAEEMPASLLNDENVEASMAPSPQPEAVQNGVGDQGADQRIISCVLTLKVKNLQMVGELAERIKYWVTEICNVHKWMLVELQIQPDYLLCATRMFQSTEPVDPPTILRSKLSDLIYKLYPLIKNQGELWETSEMLINEKIQVANGNENDSGKKE